MKIAIVIPALNEAATIKDVVRACRELGTVIVVDDGSQDETAELAGAAGAVVVRHTVNQGYDAAIKSGFEKADELGAEVIVTADADGQIPVGSVRAAIREIVEESAELVIGVRDRQARISERLFSRYVLSRYGVPDILCGLKAFTGSLYRRHRHCFEASSIYTGAALSALRDDAKSATVPVTVQNRDGESRFGSTLKANMWILRVFAEFVLSDVVKK